NASPRHAYHPDTGPISLSRFDASLWMHLYNVADSGVALIDAQGDPVRLRRNPADLGIDLTADATGTVTLDAAFTDDDGPVDLPPGAYGFVGGSPHGAFVETVADGLTLIPF